MAARVLFRPVGLIEATLILESGSRRFPPRLPEQPIFYPVLNREYAAQIARDWNAPKEPHFAGFVTQFEIDPDYVSRFEERVVGASIHRELWVPAEQLKEFNQHIVGPIEIIESFYGEGYRGPDALGPHLKGVPVERQLSILAANPEAAAADRILARLNFDWWSCTPASLQGVTDASKSEVLRRISPPA